VCHLGYGAFLSCLRHKVLTDITYTKTRLCSQSDEFSGSKGVFVYIRVLLSFQLKCSSNIDSIHYLGLTNSYKFKFFLLPVRFLMVNRFWNEILLAHLKVTGSWSILYPMNWSARGNVLNQYLRNTSIGTTVCLYCLPVQQFTCGYELIYVIAHKQNLFELWSVILIWFAVSAGNFKTTKWKIFVWCWTVPHRAQTRCLNFIKNNTVVAHFTSPCYPYWTIT
jgi:hypothetical protein